MVVITTNMNTSGQEFSIAGMFFPNTSQILIPVLDSQDDMSLTPLTDPVVSDEALRNFQFICYGVVLQIISIFGTVTNIINIICFVKQGFKDPVNVSLLGLAISDLIGVSVLLFTNICFFPLFQEMDLPFDSIDLQHMITGWMHVMFSRVTSWITALITLERCLCITMPLKVKNIFTPKRVALIIVGIYIVIIGGNCSKYLTAGLGMKFSPDRNRTIIRMVYRDGHATVEAVSYAINIVLFPLCSFLIIVICTIVLVVKLREKAEWRRNCATAAVADSTSERDQRVTKMVVMISTLFISCFVPLCFIFIAILIVPGFVEGGLYYNTLLVMIGVSFLLQSTNSATNIFIYYHMSSRYKLTFRELFKRKERCTKDKAVRSSG